MAVICYLEKFKTSILDKNLYRCGSGIDRIFNKFFQSMHRGDDDLPGGDFVDDIRIQRLDLCQYLSTFDFRGDMTRTLIRRCSLGASSASSAVRLVPRGSGVSISIASSIVLYCRLRDDEGNLLPRESQANTNKAHSPR